jgi:hypothetical protein
MGEREFDLILKGYPETPLMTSLRKAIAGQGYCLGDLSSLRLSDFPTLGSKVHQFGSPR